MAPPPLPASFHHSSPAIHQVLTEFDPLVQPDPASVAAASAAASTSSSVQSTMSSSIAREETERGDFSSRTPPLSSVSSPTGPTPSQSSNSISFKRRTPSRSQQTTGSIIRAGLLGSILSRSNEEQASLIPELASPSSSPLTITPEVGTTNRLKSRAEAPGKVTIPSSPFQRISRQPSQNALAIASDEEAVDDDESNDPANGIIRPNSIAASTGGRLGSVKSTNKANRGGGWQNLNNARVSFGAQAERPKWGRASSGNYKRSGEESSLLSPGLLSPNGDPYSRHRYPSSGMAERSESGDGGGLPPIPAALPAADEYSTPLPTIPIIVLCIAMFGEFLSASLSSPFLYFMIEDFGVGQGPDGGGEAAVGFWTGVVSSTFFLSQFLTSMLWVSVAERHGRRAVLFVSLLGNGITLIAFGTSKNLGSAICVRLGMGLFNGAVGVARSAVQSITDSTNEGRAFTYMGLCWGLGGIVGSVIGGLTEHPVINLPYFFGRSTLFVEYPYLLPCLIAGSVTLIGALLSLFLNADGGPRMGGIALPTEKDMESAAKGVGALPGAVARKVSSLFHHKSFTSGSGPLGLGRSSGLVTPVNGLANPLSAPLGSGVSYRESDRLREAGPSGRRTSNRYGSAYYPAAPSIRSGRLDQAGDHGGVGGSGFSRVTGLQGAGRRDHSLMRNRTISMTGTSVYAPDYENDFQDFSFAQRLLLANEQAVFSISDLWVAAATQNDDQYSQIDYRESEFDGENEEDEGTRVEDESRASIADEPDFFGFGTAPPSMEDIRGQAHRQDLDRFAAAEALGKGSPALEIPQTPGSDFSPSRGRGGSRDRFSSYGGIGVGGLRTRRASMASSMRGPSIYANTGLDPGSLAVANQQSLAQPLNAGGELTFNPTMAAIPEARPASVISEDPEADGQEKKPIGLIRQLPLVMIAQYTLMALHGCTCDQIFMSFLVTPVASGGLGLKAANYAALVAAMFFFNMVWQFRFYPFVGPPRGSLSHLAMFRLGLALYIPVYLLFPELRGLLHDGGNGWVMFGMTLLSSIRYLANTCSYTAVMVLVNAMSPPHLVPLANGLAQSSVSLARFIGPLVGGTLWAASIANGPNAHPWPFNYAFPFMVIACICLLGFLHSFRIR